MTTQQPGKPNGPSRSQIVAMAREWLGTPYVHQASAKGQGADCLGLVRGVWRELYGTEPAPVPAYTPDWAEQRGDEPLQRAAATHLVPAEGIALPGMVLLFRVVPGGPAKHLGILTDENRFLHAYAGRAVSESWLSSWWQSRLAGHFDFPWVTA